MAGNYNLIVNGTKLVIEVDLSKDLGLSKSGKNVLVASTKGNISIPNHPEIKMGLNIYRDR